MALKPLFYLYFFFLQSFVFFLTLFFIALHWSREGFRLTRIAGVGLGSHPADHGAVARQRDGQRPARDRVGGRLRLRDREPRVLADVDHRVRKGRRARRLGVHRLVVLLLPQSRVHYTAQRCNTL